MIWILGPANVWDNIETLAYTLQVCRPGSVVFCVGAYLAAVVREFFPAQTTGQLKRCSFTRQNLAATYRGFWYVLQYYWLNETLVPRFLACTFWLPAPKGAASGHAGAFKRSTLIAATLHNLLLNPRTFQDLLFSWLTFYHNWCNALRLPWIFCFTYHRSTIIVATL